MSSVTFTYTGASPASLSGSSSFDCHGYMQLLGVAPGEGGNVKVGESPGLLARALSRGELAVGLDWTVRGHAPIGGGAPQSYFDQLHLNVAALQRWFDVSPGRLLTVTVTVGATNFTSDLQHVEFSDPQWQGRQYQTQQTVRVPAGVLS